MLLQRSRLTNSMLPALAAAALLMAGLLAPGIA